MGTKPPIRLADDRDPWERQAGESHRQYSRFRAFMELGRARTLKQTKEMLDTLGDKLSQTSLYQVAYSYRWTERAEAHDRDQDRLERERLLVLRREMRARHRKLASGLMAKAVARLTALQPGELTPLDIVRFIKQATGLEMQALGEPEHTVAISGPGGGPFVVEDFAHYTPSERRSRLEAIASELSRRAVSRDDDDDDE